MLGHPAQPRDRVVVDEHDAERRVADHDRQQSEREADRVEGRVEGHPGHDPRKRDREDDEERDRLSAEEVVARDGERRERPEHHCASVAPKAALIDTQSASRAPWLWSARSNQSSVKPSIGHAWIRLELNA